MNALVTTNLTFSEWGKVLTDEKDDHSDADRFIHHCKVIEAGNDGYRFKLRMKSVR
ncbi:MULTISPECIES: ATP-binding protein [Aeromonas]|jgi:DNA replication protein DnaC|uniref:ATP-binding protein n=1 Tax=Aeromonas TaxID=642 RepID=UPI00290E7CC5|nr:MULTISPECIES: ATP-binding protein [Aeromonas]MDU7579321.1 ATP-binding protein [Aeromonas sp.]MDX7777800.1 ATP-binding protein [Aeromonas hydrophila]